MQINSVNGPISVDDLGVTLMHEHVIGANWAMRVCFKEKWLERDIAVNIAVGQLKKAREKYNITTIVDGAVPSLGRDISIIKEVSEKSGVNIIVSSGFYFTEEPFLQYKPVEVFIDLMMDECTNGIEGTSILPGMLKCATDIFGFTMLNETILQATAVVQKKTNLPIFAHTDTRNNRGLGVLDRFEKQGVDPSRIIIGHVGDTSDIDYLEAILKRGGYIGLDRFGVCNYLNSLENRVNTVYELVKRGWIDKIILSHDYSAYIDWGGYIWEKAKASYLDGSYLNREVDYTYIHREAIPLLLEKGLTQSEIDHMLIDNPKAFFIGK